MSSWRQSSIETMLQCGEKYRRSYETDEQAGTTAASIMGTAVHEAIAFALKNLVNDGVLEGPAQIGQQGTGFFLRLVELDKEAEDPIPWSEGAVEARAQEVNVMASALWEAMPTILEEWGSPHLIETKFEGVPLVSGQPLKRVLLPGEYDVELEGTWDLLTDQHKLIDWKTTEQSWKPGIEMSKVQPLVYARGVEHMTGAWPRTFCYIVVNRKGRIWQKPVPINRERYEYLLATVPELERQRQAKIFPLNADSSLCSPTWCPWYLRGCPAAKFKGEVA